MKQRFTSKDTSINATKLPRIYSVLSKQLVGKTVIDYGCGKYFDNYIKKVDCKQLVGYDPFNRPDNNVLLSRYDVALCSNVLNVIDSLDARDDVISNLRVLASTVYITVYEGDRSGQGKATKTDCYQTNMKVAEYIPELMKHFDSVTLKNGIITCC